MSTENSVPLTVTVFETNNLTESSSSSNQLDKINVTDCIEQAAGKSESEKILLNEKQSIITNEFVMDNSNDEYKNQLVHEQQQHGDIDPKTENAIAVALKTVNSIEQAIQQVLGSEHIYGDDYDDLHEVPLHESSGCDGEDEDDGVFDDDEIDYACAESPVSDESIFKKDRILDTESVLEVPENQIQSLECKKCCCRPTAVEPTEINAKESTSSASDMSPTENRRDSDDSDQLYQLKSNDGERKISTDSIENEPYEIPDDEFSAKIVEQVEFYFSNENILKDAFLLKHVKRNKEGFVSLKLVSSFKRVRQLTKDWRIVGEAIKKKGIKIELNELNTKIRRIDPLPDYDETMPSRTVVATDLPISKYTIEKISDLFSKCGEIALIRLMRPGGTIPADVRQFINKYPEMQERECALIEFNESNAARKALQMNGMTVMEMVAPKKKTGKKASIAKLIETYKYHHDHEVERSRGSEQSNSRYHMKRQNSIGYQKPLYPQQFHHQHHHNPHPLPMYPHHGATIPYGPIHAKEQIHQYLYGQRRYQMDNENYDYFNVSPVTNPVIRRASNPSMVVSNNNVTDQTRRYSNGSEGYTSHSEISRRPSSSTTCSDNVSRRTSSCSDGSSSRRTSDCSDCCPCSRRLSQTEMYRRVSQPSSEQGRRYSNGSINERLHYHGQPSTGQIIPEQLTNSGNNSRRVSFENDYITNAYEYRRRLSNNFDPVRKLSGSEYEYYKGRRISTDSGYDRRGSIGSMHEYNNVSPQRSRAGSLICSNKITENVVRTPIGPDGSKGFANRTRKVGQIIPPV